MIWAGICRGFADKLALSLQMQGPARPAQPQGV